MKDFNKQELLDKAPTYDEILLFTEELRDNDFNMYAFMYPLFFGVLSTSGYLKVYENGDVGFSDKFSDIIDPDSDYEDVDVLLEKITEEME